MAFVESVNGANPQTKVAVTLGALNPRAYEDVALAADASGYDAVFMSDHLVIPEHREGSLHQGQEVSPTTPLTDALSYLSFLAAKTTRIQLGTFVYLLGLRHPFVAARAFGTLDNLSGGRAICGVGAGWLTSEWDAVGLDPRSRGARLDEAIDICRLLWTSNESTSFTGRHFQFEGIRFVPRPVAEQGIPIMIGGESRVALRRAALRGDGWVGRRHTPESAALVVAELNAIREEGGVDGDFEVTVLGDVDCPEDLVSWSNAGVHRVVTMPWTSSRTAAKDIEAHAERIGLDPNGAA
ncbi:TIGR03619 family F420-dependent LLM class oxidoreductase [Rhodococcus erythropolis]|uniref:TIGR03619 family F420-dependent LLM class oxidoreductase n=1 Tax=Rhodococcus erythropolis TaxID=1833 RepID=UPI003796AA68